MTPPQPNPQENSGGLTSPSGCVTLGGRDGSYAILVEETSWHRSYPTPPQPGLHTVPVKPSSVMGRVRWLSQLEAWLSVQSAAGELVGVQLPMFDVGETDE